MRALLFAFEGCDASGKTTQATLFAGKVGALLTREPGDTAAGARIRSLLLDHSPEGAKLGSRAEALLMAADRAQHVHELIEPALEAGTPIVTDRYIASSVAYQGFGRGLDPAEIARLSLWATDGRLPDLTVLLRVPVAVVMDRLGKIGAPDRLESLGSEFFDRVVAGFDAIAAGSYAGIPPLGLWAVVDGCGSIAEVEARVWAAVVEHFPDLAA